MSLFKNNNRQTRNPKQLYCKAGIYLHVKFVWFYFLVCVWDKIFLMLTLKLGTKHVLTKQVCCKYSREFQYHTISCYTRKSLNEKFVGWEGLGMGMGSRSGLTVPLSRHCVGTYQKMSSHATSQGSHGHSHLSSLSHCVLILV